MWKKTYNNEQARIKKTITGIIGIVFLFYPVSCTLIEDILSLEEGDAGTPSLPGEVRDLEVSDPSYDGADDTAGFKVVWDAPTNTGISTNGNTSILTGYEVAYAEVSGDVRGEYTSATNKPADTEHVFSSLDPGKEYDIRIKAMTAVGLGPASHISGWTPSLPGVVDRDSITFTEATTNTIRIEWTAPELGKAGGDSPTNTPTLYKVEIAPDGGSEYTVIQSNYSGTDITVSNLNESTSYLARITAKNKWGEAVASISTTKGTTAKAEPTPPSAVENLKVDSFAYSEVTLSWKAPIHTGTTDGITPATLSGYVIKYKETTNTDSEFIGIDEKGDGVRLATALTNTSTDATVIGLNDNTSYTFLVVAVHSGNVVGLDAEAPTVEQTTLLREPTPPSAVENLKVDSLTDTQVVISWTAPSNTGTTDGTTPATLSGYVVKYKKTADSEFIEIDEQSKGVQLVTALTGASTNATVIGLDGNTSYTFLVVAIHSGDVVGLDEEASTVEQTTVPTPPENLRKTNTCDKTTSVELAWDASPGATSYKLYRNGEVFTNSANSYTDTGLTAGTEYAYKVQACSTAGCSGDSDSLTITTLSDKSFKSIIDSGQMPRDLDGYDERSREIFPYYKNNGDDPLVAKYVKPGGAGTKDGSSFDDAAEDLKTILDGIDDANSDQVNIIFLTGGNYKAGGQMSMKNYTAIIGGVDECLNPSDMVTALDGDNSYRVFYNYKNNLTNTALLYGVAVINGQSVQGGGMYNMDSSPSLVGVTFSENTATNGTVGGNGGGMYNNRSFPSLVGVTFSENSAGYGGGMYNFSSSPSLVGVTFSENTVISQGGGMYNNVSSPSLVGVTFSENTANKWGGGMYNSGSSPILEGVTFSGNLAIGSHGAGGGMYNWMSSPSLVGVTFSGNHAAIYGGGMYNDNEGKAGPRIINGIFWGNTANTDGPQFYFENYNNAQENLRVYNSIVEGGTGTLVSGTSNIDLNQGGFVSGGGFGTSVKTDPVVISFSNIIATDPGLGELADNGGSVWTHAIMSTSPAANQGLYVKRKDNAFYYSEDSTAWYTNPDLSGTGVTVPTDAVDVTDTDATGYTRTDRPDLGAYEAR